MNNVIQSLLQLTFFPWSSFLESTCFGAFSDPFLFVPSLWKSAVAAPATTLMDLPERHLVSGRPKLTPGKDKAAAQYAPRASAVTVPKKEDFLKALRAPFCCAGAIRAGPRAVELRVCPMSPNEPPQPGQLLTRRLAMDTF